MTAEDKNTKQNADQPSKSKEQPSNQNDKLTKDDGSGSSFSIISSNSRSISRSSAVFFSPL
jgi:hypothetical protein